MNAVKTQQSEATATITSLPDVQGLTIDQAALRAHQIRPANTQGMSSSWGLLEGAPIPEFSPRNTPVDGYLDVPAFASALHARLKDSVAGYAMRLQQHGSTIYTLEWQWAKTPGDGSEGWTPAVRMHIASCSKLMTGIAMTKVLDDNQIAYDTPIINYLPQYWTKGMNVGKITFRHLMTHTSGLNYGVKSSESDYVFMKDQIAAGTSNLGKYWYQNHCCPKQVLTAQG